MRACSTPRASSDRCRNLWLTEERASHATRFVRTHHCEPALQRDWRRESLPKFDRTYAAVFLQEPSGDTLSKIPRVFDCFGGCAPIQLRTIDPYIVRKGGFMRGNVWVFGGAVVVTIIAGLVAQHATAQATRPQVPMFEADPL